MLLKKIFLGVRTNSHNGHLFRATKQHRNFDSMGVRSAEAANSTI
jgi:hypothetical protein